MAPWSAGVRHGLGQARQIRNVTSVEAAAEELLKWPKNKKRDRAAILVTDAYAGKATVEAAKKAFEDAAKEAGVWVQYRGPLA